MINRLMAEQMLAQEHQRHQRVSNQELYSAATLLGFQVRRICYRQHNWLMKNKKHSALLLVGLLV